MKKIEYMLVEGDDSAALSKRVNELLEEKWELWGSPSMANKDELNAKKKVFFQAMTRPMGKPQKGKTKRKMSEWADRGA